MREKWSKTMSKLLRTVAPITTIPSNPAAASNPATNFRASLAPCVAKISSSIPATDMIGATTSSRMCLATELPLAGLRTTENRRGTAGRSLAASRIAPANGQLMGLGDGGGAGGRAGQRRPGT